MVEYQLSDIDADRENFLYSPFPTEKSLNPKHWESKLQFWSEEIVKSCKFNREVCANCLQLQATFKSKNSNQTPKGLQTVLSCMYESGNLLLKSDVSDLSPDQTWGQWSVSLAYNSSSWLWRKLVAGVNENTEFVVKEVVEEMAMELLQVHYNSVQYDKTDYVVPWSVLKTYQIGNRPIAEETLTYLIGYLKNNGMCKIGITPENEKIIKFKKKSQSKVEPITKTDFETINLKKSIAKLTLAAKSIEKELLQLKVHAQTLLKSNDRTQAKKVLVQKQKLEKKLRMKQDALFAMKDHLGMVRDSETTKLITDAFNSSATLLNQTYKEQGLTIDHVENVIDKASEANEMARDVSDAISGGLNQLGDDEFDMDELEQELAEIGSQQQQEDEQSTIFNLPQVPKDSPIKAATPSVGVNTKKTSRRVMETTS